MVPNKFYWPNSNYLIKYDNAYKVITSQGSGTEEALKEC